MKVANTENRHVLEGAVGRAITERNDHELGLDNEAIGDGALANGGQCCASTLRKMRNIPLVISDPFSFTDIVANTYGIIVGNIFPSNVATHFAISTGNYIPGPGEPDPAFNGGAGGRYQGNPSAAWGQYP